MAYALNLNADNRILSACVVLPNGRYDGMPIVTTLPDGDIADYLYVGKKYVYNPNPTPVPPEEAPTQEDRIKALEEELVAAKILLGVEV